MHSCPRKEFADKFSSVSQEQIGYLQARMEAEAAWPDGLLFSGHTIGVPVYEWHSMLNDISDGSSLRVSTNCSLPLEQVEECWLGSCTPPSLLWKQGRGELVLNDNWCMSV